MSLTPLSRTGPRQRLSGQARMRQPPTPGSLARRRLLLTAIKFLLPAAALALLASIALWPEFDRASNEARLAMHRFSGEVNGAEVTDARYRGVDEQNRPYTLTAATARQDGPGIVDLTSPDGDISMQNGTWLSMKARFGTFVQHTNLLDLWKDVELYRDDGTTLYTQNMSMDLHNDAATGSQPVHAEGPFGTLDAQGFALTDKGQVIQFTGPARLVLNGGKP